MQDGFIDVWDYYYRQNEVAYTHKISDNPLTYISIQGKYAAIGDSEGTVTIMQLCDSLHQLQKGEKDVMLQIFEREYRREKNLEVAKRLAEQKKPLKKEGGKGESKEKKLQDELMNLEEKFYKQIGIDPAEAAEKAAARAEAIAKEEADAPGGGAEEQKAPDEPGEDRKEEQKEAAA